MGAFFAHVFVDISSRAMVRAKAEAETAAVSVISSDTEGGPHKSPPLLIPENSFSF